MQNKIDTIQYSQLSKQSINQKVHNGDQCEININEHKQNEDNLQDKQESHQEIDHYADDTPLPKSKPFDLKQLWLGQTNQTLEKFNMKFKELKKQQKDLYDGFRMFEESQNKYKLSSLRKIQFKLDKKTLYNEYMIKTRKTIQKLNPALIINILSYADENLFYILFRMRKVSKIFNQIFLNQSIQYFMATKDYLYDQQIQKARKFSTEMCKKYLKFHKTFLYYKSMQYCEQIPQNSIMKDFEQAVNFINEIHRLVVQKQNRNFTYYILMNNFMKKHRVVIGLSSLSLTSLIMVRKAAIIAFSNYLAFNQEERSKQQITKTKYSKVITVVQYEDYRDSLILNTKISNFLWQKYNQNFAVVITKNIGMVWPYGGQNLQSVIGVRSWNILIYHYHNEQNAIYLEQVELKQNKFTSARLDIQFQNNMEICKFSTIQYLNWVKMEAYGKRMDIIGTPVTQIPNLGTQLPDQPSCKEEFSYCYVYKLEQYYIIAIPHQFQ